MGIAEFIIGRVFATTRGLPHPAPSGVLAVLAAPVRQQEHHERERADERGDPGPGLDAASAMLGQQAGNIDRGDRADDQQDVHGGTLRYRSVADIVAPTRSRCSAVESPRACTTPAKTARLAPAAPLA